GLRIAERKGRLRAEKTKKVSNVASLPLTTRLCEAHETGKEARGCARIGGFEACAPRRLRPATIRPRAEGALRPGGGSLRDLRGRVRYRGRRSLQPSVRALWLRSRRRRPPRLGAAPHRRLFRRLRGARDVCRAFRLAAREPLEGDRRADRECDHPEQL